MEPYGIQIIGMRKKRRRGSGGPFLAGAAVHLNFVAQKYYWNGAARLSSDFTSFSGGTLGVTGLTLDGSGTHNISVTTAALGITFPCAIIACFTPASVTGNQAAAAIDSATTDEAWVGLNGANRIIAVTTGGVSQASVISAGAAIGTRVTVGGNFETNNILESVDSAIGGAADTSATLPAINAFRIGERNTSFGPMTGTIHNVVIFSGAKTQAELNDLTYRVSYLFR